MNIDTMKVAIRPMSTAQALDLGMVMARHWFVPLWKIWLGMALPVYLLFYLGGILLDNQFGITMSVYGGLVFWWLKPIYEKPMMAWLGEALFTELPSVKSSVRSGWRSAKDFIAVLLFRKRLSFQRQLILPILVLERPDASQFKSRLPLLARGQGGALTWHTLIMVHIELVISLSILVFIWQLIPTEFMKAETLFAYIDHASFWNEVAWSLIYFLAASVIAPFYIASGFAVYLTKRCLLEGWDVELVFKQLSRRYQQTQANPLTQLIQENANRLEHHSASSSLPQPADTTDIPATSLPHSRSEDE